MPHIEEIFLHESDSGAKGSLGIDDAGKLYWNERAVITEQKVTLTPLVNLAVILGGFATLSIAVFSGLTYFGL